MKPYKIILLSALLFPATLYAAKQPERKDTRAGNKEYKKGNYIESELSYRRAQEKAPESVNVKYNLGNALYKQLDSTQVQGDEVKQQLEQIHKLYENAAESEAMSDKQKAAAYYNSGNTYLREQNFGAAVDAYKKSLRLNPDDMEAKQNLIYAQAMQNQQQEQPQQQPQDQDKKDQDKDKDKDKDQNQDQQQQEQQQNQEQNQDQKDKKDQQQQEEKISKEDAQRMLQALEQQEKETQEKVKKEKAKKAQQRSTDKNW